MANELTRHLLSLTLACSAGLLVVLAMRRPVRHLFGAACCYSLWLLVPVAMLAGLLPHAGSSVSITWIIRPVSALSHALEARSDLAVAAHPSLSAAPATDWSLLVPGIWGLGAALVALYLTVQQRAFVRGLGDLSGSRCVLRAARPDGGPALLGVFRPKIILPGDFDSRYTRLERLLIFRHERTHLRRGDALVNALVALARCAFWFNPLVHLASLCLRLDQEFACDAAVIQHHPAARRPYACAMLKTQLAERALPAGCHWRSAQGLKDRVQMLKSRAPSRVRRRWGIGLTGFLSVAVGCTTWATQPPAGGPPLQSRPTQPPATAGSAPALESTGGFVLEDIRNGRWLLPSIQNTLSLSADRIIAPPDDGQSPQRTVMDGHIHMEFTSATDGELRAHALVVEMNRATLSKQADDSSLLQFEEGRMEVRPAPDGPPDSSGASRARFMVTPNFKDADLRLVAEAVASATHRNFIIDPRVHAEVTMLTSAPMTPEDFYQALLLILQVHGFVAIPDGGLIKIVPDPRSSWMPPT